MRQRGGAKLKEVVYMIINRLGIHARPAAEIAKIASKYDCDVTLLGNNKQANAKSLLMIMALGIKNGQEVTIAVDGPDEDKAIEALDVLITNNFYED